MLQNYFTVMRQLLLFSLYVKLTLYITLAQLAFAPTNNQNMNHIAHRSCFILPESTTNIWLPVWLDSCLDAQLTNWWSRWFTVWLMDYLSGWWEQSVPGLLTAALGAFSQRCRQLQRSSDFCIHSHRGDKWVPYEDGKRGRLKQEEKPIGQALEGNVESPRKRPFLSVWMEVRS